MRAISVVVALALAAVGGCSSGAPGGTLHLSWRFADGRDCANAGASRVELRLRPIVMDDAPDATFGCAMGLDPASVTSDALPGDGTLYLDARSTAGGDLYRGMLALDGAPFKSGAVAVVTLFAAFAN